MGGRRLPRQLTVQLSRQLTVLQSGHNGREEREHLSGAMDVMQAQAGKSDHVCCAQLHGLSDGWSAATWAATWAQ